MGPHDDRHLEREMEWLKGLKNSDLESFKQIFEFYVVRLRRYVVASNIPADVGEDIIQDIFVSLWDRRVELLLSKGNLGTYLIGALHKKILQHNRNIGLRAEIFEKFSEDVRDLSSAAPRPDSYLLNAELKAVFSRALSELSETQRQIVALRWGEEMPFSRISEILGISENAAMLHASRIKSSLRPILQRYFKGLK